MFGCGIPHLARSSICREPVTVHRTATAIKQREKSTAVVMTDSEAAALVQKTVVGPTARQMRAAVAVVEALGSVLVCPPALALHHQLQVLAHRQEPHRRLAPVRWGNESQVGAGSANYAIKAQERSISLLGTCIVEPLQKSSLARINQED